MPERSRARRTNQLSFFMEESAAIAGGGQAAPAAVADAGVERVPSISARPTPEPEPIVKVVAGAPGAEAPARSAPIKRKRATRSHNLQRIQTGVRLEERFLRVA